ncbi:MAG: transposase, partial [Proteobacteria bacterium]|nr:transposase [Pseudomonadota bacterium]
MAPGKPGQNGANESFNAMFRDECLDMQWFKNRIDAKVAIEDGRKSSNQVRPWGHGAVLQMNPVQCMTLHPVVDEGEGSPIKRVREAFAVS